LGSIPLVATSAKTFFFSLVSLISKSSAAFERQQRSLPELSIVILLIPSTKTLDIPPESLH
jgi:hypothetical protein